MSDFAFVTFVMLGSDYVLAALVLAHSLRKQRTAADIVCLVTADVHEGAQEALRKIYTTVVKVPYLSALPGNCLWNPGRFSKFYEPWIHKSFTRFHALLLTQYKKICVVDADALCLSNPDDVFVLNPPAAVVSWVGNRGYFPGPGSHAHGEQVDPRCVGNQRWQQNASCGMLLLAPSREDHRELVRRVRSFRAVAGCAWGPDEQVVTEFYNARGWTNIGRDFWCTAWRCADLERMPVRNTRRDVGAAGHGDEHGDVVQAVQELSVGVPPLPSEGQTTRNWRGNKETYASQTFDPASVGDGTAEAPILPSAPHSAVRVRFLHYVSEKPWACSSDWPDMDQWRQIAREVLQELGVDRNDTWLVKGWDR